MADWQVVSVLKKSKVFQVQSNTIFNLRDLTEGVPWGNVTLDVSISSVDMGYDVISLETSYEDLGNNQYRAHVYRYKLYPQTMQYLNVPVNGVWNTYYLGEDCGGVSISGQVAGSTNPSSLWCDFLFATPRHNTYDRARVIQIDNKGQGSSGVVDYKIAPPKLGNSALSYVGFGYTGNTLTIAYTPYALGAREEISGTLTILAVET